LVCSSPKKNRSCARFHFRASCSRDEEDEDWKRLLRYKSDRLGALKAGKLNRTRALRVGLVGLDAHSASGGDSDMPQPFCQANILRELLGVVEGRLKERNVDRFWSYGTILGAKRDQKIIPWTMDIDVVFEPKQFHTLHHSFSKGWMEASGYTFFFDPQYGALARICIAETNELFSPFFRYEPEPTKFFYDGYPYVDLYKLGGQTRQGSIVNIENGPPCKFAWSDIYPLGTVKLYNFELPAPRNASNFLRTLYGPTWPEQPDPTKVHAHGAYQLACKQEWAPKTFK
jgi:LicD family